MSSDPGDAATGPAGISPPLRRLVVILTALLIVPMAALVFLALHDRSAGIFASRIGGPFRLVDQNGRNVTDADLRGKWALVYFGFTHCDDTCPTVLNNLALALDRLGPARTRVREVFISVDPERDTPAVLKAYVDEFAAPILALTGTPQAVAEAASGYRVIFAKHPKGDGGYDVDHSSVVYIMDPNGKLAGTLLDTDPPKEIAARLRKLLS
jgi:protein SCO1/2